MTAERWLETHAYLRPLASFCALVEEAAGAAGGAGAFPPPFEDYRADFLEGIPLLGSPAVSIDLAPAATTLERLLERLAGATPGPFASEIQTLRDGFLRDPGLSRRIVAWLAGGDSPAPGDPGLTRYLGWTALARHLAPTVAAFDAWRDDERWRRGDCPTCGAAPAMAHLAEAESSRARRLCCGQCRTRWSYPRTRCPFCEADSQRLAVLAAEGEGGLRIDYCEACRGYLKTYAGQGGEALLLSDWSSLHLDVAAADRGLERRAASLYDFGTLLAR